MLNPKLNHKRKHINKNSGCLRLFQEIQTDQGIKLIEQGWR